MNLMLFNGPCDISIIVLLSLSINSNIKYKQNHVHEFTKSEIQSGIHF